eukprot:symbB.v1.2.029760.t2/scaffold3294.1/size59574/1
MLPDPFRLTTVPRTLKPGEPRPLPTQEARHLIEAYQRLLEELLPAQEAIEADQARQNFAQNSLFCVHLMHVFQERMAWGLLQAKQAQPPDASLDMQVCVGLTLEEMNLMELSNKSMYTFDRQDKSQSRQMQPFTSHVVSKHPLVPAKVKVPHCPRPVGAVYALLPALVGRASCASGFLPSKWLKQPAARGQNVIGAACPNMQSAAAGSQCLLTQLDATAGQVLLQESPIVLDLWQGFRRQRCIKASETFNSLSDWTVEKEASGGDEDMLRFLQVLRVNGIEALLSPFGSRKRRAQVGCAAADKGWRRDYSVLLI